MHTMKLSVANWNSYMIIDKTNYTKVLFVHIPKTAGSSILNSLTKRGLDPWIREYPRGHDPIWNLKKNNDLDKTFIFSVVRNPYTRTYSAFQQFNRTNKTNISFIEYLNNIIHGNINYNTPLLHLDQSFFLLEENKIAVGKIYKFENMSEFEKDFNLSLNHLNVGKYSYSDFLKAYTDDAINIVNSVYRIDFENFNYSIVSKGSDLHNV